jgi:hypothetical protein
VGSCKFLSKFEFRLTYYLIAAGVPNILAARPFFIALRIKYLEPRHAVWISHFAAKNSAWVKI